MRKYAQSFWALLTAGILVQLLVVAEGFFGIATPMGDVPNVYAPWMQQLFDHGNIWGVNVDWVYPFLALLPMLLSSLIRGLIPGHDFLAGWLVVCGALNLVAIASLVRWGRSKERTWYLMAWYFLLFELLLGPVSISRLDAISVALAVLAIRPIVESRLAAASLWLIVATWVKVWPVALILALWIASKRRLLVFGTASIATLAILGVGLVAGGNASMFSFISTQSNRGIQIEAPIATPWLWQGVFGVSGSGIYYDHKLLTFQVFGFGVSLVAALMGFAMLIALAITVWLGWQAGKSGNDTVTVIAAISLTASLDMIVFNKVGSPQYIAWLLVPLLLALLRGQSLPVISGLVLAGLTHLIYPVIYDGILLANPAATAVLGVRNIVLIALLVWSNLWLTKLGKPVDQESSSSRIKAPTVSRSIKNPS